MSERRIVGKSSEPMAMDTCKDLRLRAAAIPPLAEAEGFPDRDLMGNSYACSAKQHDIWKIRVAYNSIRLLLMPGLEESHI